MKLLPNLQHTLQTGVAAAIVLLSAATSAQQVGYQYDALNRLTSVTDQHGTTSFQYDAVGNRTLAEYPNGVTTQYIYDARNRLIEQIATDPGGTIIQHYKYELDATGKRTQLQELHSGRTSDWTYDSLNRLTSETVTDAQGGYSTSWTHDAVGNRLSQTEDGTITTYSYDNNDRLLTETDPSGTTTYTYDERGNLTTKTGPNGIDTYTYDGANRLASATTAAGTYGATYDADGIRQSRTENGSTIANLIDPNQSYAQVLAEYESLGTELAAYTRSDSRLINQDRAGTLAYYHQDALGSTRQLTDQTGTITDQYDYTAFGDLDQRLGTTDNQFLYTGEQFDPALDQYYLRARYMDPGVGRFAQLDTWSGIIRIPKSLNKYVYTEEDPINNIDPSGNFIVSFAVRNTIRGVLTVTTSRLPSLGFTFLRSAAGHIVGIAATACALNYTATYFAIVTPTGQFSGCEGNGHRGRWQAQGGGLEESEPWSQPFPLTLTKGLLLLDTLESKLRPADRRARAPYFAQARAYARKLASVGGVSARDFGGSRSFPTRNQPPSYPRVDLEINSGHAFTNE